MATMLDVPILSCCPPGCENRPLLQHREICDLHTGFAQMGPQMWFTQSFLLHVMRGETKGWSVYVGPDRVAEVERVISVRTAMEGRHDAKGQPWVWISLKSPGWVVKYDGYRGSWRWELVDTYHNNGFMQMGVWPD